MTKRVLGGFTPRKTPYTMALLRAILTRRGPQCLLTGKKVPKSKRSIEHLVPVLKRRKSVCVSGAALSHTVPNKVITIKEKKSKTPNKRSRRVVEVSAARSIHSRHLNKLK